MSSSAERELEEQLKEAGNKLLDDPPSSPDDLLPLLDQVENFLSRVEQSPAKSMQAALSPLTQALATNKLLGHSNVDVKVAVASCISEITRITAPDAPYDDDKMREVFHLIVASFDNLPDKSSRSYNKRALILETVAKVRSCVVMLDLECDALIAEMFQLFVRMIRDYHPENIFTSMETIMTLVIEESEDIPPQILTPLLSSLKKDNQEVLPVAAKLAEKVLENCASKLKPYVHQAIESVRASFDDYNSVVTSLFRGDSYTVEHANDNTHMSAELLTDEAQGTQADENKPAASDSDETVQVAEDLKEACPKDDVDPEVDESPKAMSNGVSDSGNEKPGTGAMVEASGNAEHDLGDHPSTDKVTFKPEGDDSEPGKSLKLESNVEHTPKKRGRKSNSSTNISESSDASHVDGEKEVEELPDLQESCGKDLRGSPREDTAAEAAKPSEKETLINVSSPKASETEAMSIASPSLSGSLHDESQPEKTGRPKKKDSLIKEETPSVDFATEKATEGTNDSEAEPDKHAGKRVLAVATNEDKLSADVDTSKSGGGGGGGSSDSEIKQIRELDKKVDESSNIEDVSSLKENQDGKKRGRGKVASSNEVTKSSAKDDLKQMIASPKPTTKSAKGEGSQDESLKTSGKRKHITGKDKASDALEYGDNLVGAKVRVYWPDDDEFYAGVIKSFDLTKKRHKVLYDDGDVENLNLRKETWELIEDSLSSKEQAAEDTNPDVASRTQKRKRSKTNPESAKHGRSQVSPKSGAASSSKSKGIATKSGHKSRDEGIVESKSKDRTSKSGGKSEDDVGGKSKAHSQKNAGKYVDDSPKKSIKSRDADGTVSKTKSKQETLKIASKSKQDSPKTGTKSKGKTFEAGVDTNTNGTGKVKHISSKTKGKSSDSAKTLEGIKARSSEKIQESEAVSMKKRRRGG